MIEKYVDTEELKRLLSVLVVILGCLIIAGLFASIIVPGLRNANRPPSPQGTTPVVEETGWLNPEEFPRAKGSVIPPVDPKTLIEPSSELVGSGKALFEKNCTQCHGALGRGDGPAGATLNPRPRNLAEPEGWKNGSDISGIYKTLGEGIRGTSMNAFDFLSKKDRMALVHYAQSLAPFPHKPGNQPAIAELATELSSAGETIPNRIPVSAAMARLSAEYHAPPPLALLREDQSRGAGILRRILRDPHRSARVLSQSRNWKTGPRELATIILTGAPTNGFSVDSAALSAADWQELHAELMRLTASQ